MKLRDLSWVRLALLFVGVTGVYVVTVVMLSQVLMRIF